MIVSIIIPVYKVEQYVGRCLQSVIDQDCGDFSIECVIVDDCSPDGSMKIVEEIIEGCENKNISFLVVRHTENKGLSAARNSGIRAAKGDYLYFMDSDDWMMENTIKRLFAGFIDYPFLNIVMGNSLCMGINYLTNTAVTENENTPVLLNERQRILNLMLTRKLDHHAWNKLVKRSFVIAHNLFFDEGVIYEDIPWAYRLVSHIDSLLIVPCLTYVYEYNDTSIIHTIPQKADRMIDSMTFICDFLQKNPPEKECQNGLMIPHRLFVQHWMFVLIEAAGRYGTSAENRKQITVISTRMLRNACKHLRFFLALYQLLLFPPFTSLLKWRSYRSNLSRIEKGASKVLSVTERIFH